jgi:polyphosphate glucokinase
MQGEDDYMAKTNESTKTTDERPALKVGMASAIKAGSDPKENKVSLQTLVIDVGGTHVKILDSNAQVAREFKSGSTMTPEEMASGVQKLAEDWKFDRISIGYPGAVLHGKPVVEPYSLGTGWVGFDFGKAFGCPVKLINDATMQAMGSYEGGRMLFLGLGTGLGSAMIVDGVVEPMELGHLRYKKHTYEHYLGKRGLKGDGKRHWRKEVEKIIGRLFKALEPDYVVIGGGNASELNELPANCRLGENANAFKGGLLLWGDEWTKFEKQADSSNTFAPSLATLVEPS